MRNNKPLLSRPVLVATVPEEGLEVSVSTTEAERAALAEADGLVAVTALQGRFVLKRERMGQGVTVRGEVWADIVQTCTVTLDPFPDTVREDVDLLFVPEARAAEWAARSAQKEDDAEDEDPPDAIVDGRIDLGQVTAEFLALGLDPYPRKPGVVFEGDASAPEADPSPFAALARLKTDT